MRITKPKIALTVVMVLCSVRVGERALGQVPAPPAQDRLGDALPPNALRRLGSVRLSHQGTVFCTAFSPDGKTLASGGGYYDATIRLWNPQTGKEMLQIRDGGVVRDLAWSANGKLLLSASDGDGVRFWDTTTGKRSGTSPTVTGGRFTLPSAATARRWLSGNQTGRRQTSTNCSACGTPSPARNCIASRWSGHTTWFFLRMARPSHWEANRKRSACGK